MKLAQSFWVWGFMPLQFLLVLAFFFFAFSIGQYFLKRIGKPVPAFGQVVLIWLTVYAILKYLVNPPIPLHLFYNYMGLITIAVFLFISSTEASWRELTETIFGILTGTTLGKRILRAAIFVLLPLVAGITTYNMVKPVYEEPVELRTVMPSPPKVITVYPPEYFMMKKRS